MNNATPSEWSQKSLEDAVDLKMGFPFQSENFTNDSSQTPIIRIRDLTNQNITTFYDGKFDSDFLVRKGDVLIGMDGDFNIVKWKNKPSLLNQRICQVIIKNNQEFDLDYLFHDLQIQLQNIHSVTGSTTVKHLSGKDVRQIFKAFPSIKEQKKIAAILTSVDEVIENTEAQIAKLEDLKRATMNELLTKGIGHTEFKETEIGRIPKSWSISKLDEIAKRGSGHTPSKQHPEYWNGGIKWVSLADSHRLDQREINITDKKISEMGLKNSSAVMHPKGTVILSRDAGVGKSTIIGEEMAVSQHFMAWQCGEKLNNLYLYFWLQFKKNVFENIAIGSTIKTIGLDYFKKLTIALPSLNEQLKIATVINRQEDYLFQLSNKLTSLKNLKKALMQDLLTGKVRVSVN